MEHRKTTKSDVGHTISYLDPYRALVVGDLVMVEMQGGL